MAIAVKKFIWDVLFPIKCIKCSREGKWVCSNCFDNLKINNHFSCPNCSQKNDDGIACLKCQTDSYLDGLLVILNSNDLSKGLIHILKYNFVTDLLDELEPKIYDYFNKNPLRRDFFNLVPIPLHRRRFLSRGFNQAELICQKIDKITGSHTNNSLLKRVKYRSPQVGLDAKHRHTNILDDFKVSGDKNPDFNRPIMLVDDVYTTGSTMQECARELKEFGYKQVWGTVIIRG